MCHRMSPLATPFPRPWPSARSTYAGITREVAHVQGERELRHRERQQREKCADEYELDRVRLALVLEVAVKEADRAPHRRMPETRRMAWSNSVLNAGPATGSARRALHRRRSNRALFARKEVSVRGDHDRLNAFSCIDATMHPPPIIPAPCARVAHSARAPPISRDDNGASHHGRESRSAVSESAPLLAIPSTDEHV